MKFPNKTQDNLAKQETIKLIVFGFAIAVYAIFAYAFGNESICIFKVYAGMPCPGCGMTRAFLSLFEGHLHEAFFWHPLWPIVILGPMVYWVLDQRPNRSHKKNLLIWGIFIAFVTVYAYRLYLYFPEQAPMDYNSHSIFSQIFAYILK